MNPNLSQSSRLLCAWITLQRQTNIYMKRIIIILHDIQSITNLEPLQDQLLFSSSLSVLGILSHYSLEQRRQPSVAAAIQRCCVHVFGVKGLLLSI